MPARTNARNTSAVKSAVYLAGDISGDPAEYKNWLATDWIDTLRFFRDYKNAEIRFIHSSKAGVIQTISFPQATDNDGRVFTISVIPYTGRLQAHYRHPETGERRTVQNEILDPNTGKPLHMNNVGIMPDEAKIGVMRHIPRTWEETPQNSGNSQEEPKGADPGII